MRAIRMLTVPNPFSWTGWTGQWQRQKEVLVLLSPGSFCRLLFGLNKDSYRNSLMEQGKEREAGWFSRRISHTRISWHSLNDKGTLFHFFFFFLPMRSWFFNKVAYSAWLYKKTNNTPCKKSKLDPKQVKANMRSVGSSSTSTTLSGVSNWLLLHWRLVLPELSFLDPWAQNATSGCWEERFYLPSRRATAGWRLKARFAPCPQCEESLRCCSQVPARQGSQTLSVPASFKLSQLLPCFSRIYCPPEAGSETKRVYKPSVQFWLKVTGYRNPQIIFLSSSNTTSLPKQISSITAERNELDLP